MVDDSREGLLSILPPALAEHVRECRRKCGIDLAPWIDLSRVPERPLIDLLEEFRKGDGRGYHLLRRIIQERDLFEAKDFRLAVLPRYLRTLHAEGLSRVQLRRYFQASKRFAKWLASEHVANDPLAGLRLEDCLHMEPVEENPRDQWPLKAFEEHLESEGVKHNSARGATAAAAAILKQCQFREIGDVRPELVRLCAARQHGAGVSDGAARRAVGQLRRVTAWMKDQGIIEVDPLAEMRMRDYLYEPELRCAASDDCRPIFKKLEEYRRHLESDGKFARNDYFVLRRMIADCGFQQVRDLKAVHVRLWLDCQALYRRTKLTYCQAIKRFAKWVKPGLLEDLKAFDDPPVASDSCPPRVFGILRQHDDLGSECHHNLEKILDRYYPHLPRATNTERTGSKTRINAELVRVRRIIQAERYDDDNAPHPGSYELLCNLLLLWEGELSVLEMIDRWNRFPKKVRVALAGWHSLYSARIPRSDNGIRLVRRRIEDAKKTNSGEQSKPDKRGEIFLEKHEAGWSDRRIWEWWRGLLLEQREEQSPGNPRIPRSPEGVRRLRNEAKKKPFRKRDDRPRHQRNVEFYQYLIRNGFAVNDRERWKLLNAHWFAKDIKEVREGADWWRGSPEEERRRICPEYPNPVSPVRFAACAFAVWCEGNPVDGLAVLKERGHWERDHQWLKLKRQMGVADAIESLDPDQRPKAKTFRVTTRKAEWEETIEKLAAEAEARGDEAGSHDAPNRAGNGKPTATDPAAEEHDPPAGSGNSKPGDGANGASGDRKTPARKKVGAPRTRDKLREVIAQLDALKPRPTDAEIASHHNQKYAGLIGRGLVERANAKTVKDVRSRMKKNVAQ